VIGEPAIANFKYSQDTRELSCRKERPGPPNFSREIHDGFGAAMDFALTGNNAHLAQQLIGRQREKGGNAGVLQCREAKAAFFKRAAESARQRGANGAISIEEEPASGGVPAFRVSYF
jgi:hypothetical protein